jgi:starch synthase (maltosyl-transferring)
MGPWQYTLAAWIDGYASWAHGLRRKLEAGQDVELELRGGADLVEAAARRAAERQHPGADKLLEVARFLRTPADQASRAAAALSAEAAALIGTHPDRTAQTVRDPPLPLLVESSLAGFNSWYEMFPRSTGAEGRHGTFNDARRKLPYVADMGFDILYLPPVHPIGRTYRKGPDNNLTANPGDPGSPWAVGGAEGGHKSVHPELGSLADFRALVAEARTLGMALALDIAFQASPDHPYVKEHPEWFTHRADGSIQYAENPPKKYQDIYPFDFSTPSLWEELRDVFLFWIEQGVRVFRVDNPHTKPIAFWQWCLASVRAGHPEVIFLAEAFTRPKLMAILAKVGFSLSYTYFTWRTSKAELSEYIQSLAQTEMREFFRPSFWPNTPDILPEHLQFGGRGAFIARAVLAATLSPSWGIYGPPFELQEHEARPGAEEYAHNEKYEIRTWDLARPDSLRPVIKRLNQIRKDHFALHRLAGTTFHQTDNDALLCYSRSAQGGDGETDRDDALLIVVNLDPHHEQSGWVVLDLRSLGLQAEDTFQVHDLLGDARYLWRGSRNFVKLDPAVMPAQIFRIRRHVRSERTFEYYL